MSDTATAVKQAAPEKPQRSTTAGSMLIKILLVGAIDAMLIWALIQSLNAEWWLAVGFFALALVAVNLVYFTKGLPLKYLLPGLLFLIVYQLYTMVYTGYASFTNFGTGHLGTKEQAITAIKQANIFPVEGSQVYPVVPVEKGGDVSMLITDPTTGKIRLGTPDGVSAVNAADVTMTGDKATGLAGFTTLNLGTLTAPGTDFREQWDALRPPIDPETGTFLRASSITQAREVKSGMVYDPETDTMTDTRNNNTVYTPDERGNFASDAGRRLNPGWRVFVGGENYTRLLTDSTIRNNFLPITAWTFAFALLSVLTTFALGLTLAIVMQDRRMKGQQWYRLILILPYALPVFLTALLWKGMLNTDFGIINQIMPGGNIGWLTNAWLARGAVLIVNLWLGYPYMLLVCTGALTGIPGDLKEAAFVDGASGRHAFRTVVLPLLLISVAPLLISSFAFNFNNFTLIQLLTNGGPFSGSINDGGSTDLLINYTFRKAFNDTNQQLGLASAISLLIFVIVGSISAYSFRLTKKLEEMA
ncbi:MAG: ABC transporter permease subunit [Candidatus Nanopelagicales bacterium]